MAIPNVKFNIQTSGIAIIQPAAGGVPLLLGTSASGAFGQLSSFGAGATTPLANTLGNGPGLSGGPLVDAAALDLATGASQVLCWRMFSGSAVSTAMAASASIQTANKFGVTAGTGTISFKGTPAGNTPVIKITVSSSVSAYGGFDYSLDGGATFTGSTTNFTAATSYALGASGITAVLSSSAESAGLWVAGDSYKAGGIQSGATAGTGTVAISGSPVAPYGNQVGSTGVWNGVVVQITTSSTSSVAGAFNYSLDGGNTYSTAQTIPVGLTYAIPNTGLTITFSAQVGTGVWVSGDTIRAPITGFTGQAYPYGQAGFSILQVGATGSQASSKGKGTFGPGSTTALGLTWKSGPGVYGNAGSGTVTFYGAIGSNVPVIEITTASASSSTNGDFDYSLNGGGTYTGSPQSIPAPGTPVQLGTSGIWAVFSGGQTGGFYTTGVFDLDDLYGVALPSPVDQFSVVLEIVTSGTAAAATAQYVYSLDGGLTFSATQTMSSPTIALGSSGITLTALDEGGLGGTSGFQAGDVYSFNTLPPQFTVTDVANVLSILQGNSNNWGWVHVVGKSNSVSTSVTRGYSMSGMFTQLATSMAAWFTGNRFSTYALMESPPNTTMSSIDAALEAESPSLSSDYVTIGSGDAAVVSPVTGYQISRSATWVGSARCCAAPLGQDLGDVGAGAVVGVTQLYRDENQTPGLDAARYLTLRTITGVQGFYITNGNTFAPSGDDINLAQYRRVIDAACSLAYAALAIYLNASVRVLSGGTIDPRDAKAIQNNLSAKIQAGLAGQISGLSVQVDLTHDILTDSTLPVSISITPLGYTKQITVTIGFSNGVLAALAA